MLNKKRGDRPTPV